MTHAIDDKPSATPLVNNSEVSELTKHIPGDQGLEALKDITFGSVRFFFADMHEKLCSTEVYL